MRPRVDHEALDIAARRAADELYDRGVVNLEQATMLFQRAFVWAALCKHGGCVSRAAQELGMHRNSMHRIMRQLHLKAHYAKGGKAR